MNKQLYRLVFSKHLGMFIPASEAARSNTCKSSGSRLRGRRRALAALLAATTMQSLSVFAAPPAGLVPHGTMAWSNAAIDAARTNATQMTIQQTAAKAILNWQTLNLQRGETLNFDQGGNRNWSALNRIWSASPSVISGNVNASGHLYFVNQNGIIFGNGAQVSVGSLTASSLDITDTIFNNGILADSTNPVFSSLGNAGFVQVEQGAALTAASGGRIMLLGKNVTNSGVINTPEGQTILAAGEQVFLSSLAGWNIPGLLVEVNAGGTAINLGDITATHGNVTMVGLAVNQDGRIKATTSVRVNGSIFLRAADTYDIGTNGGLPGPTRSGNVSLGENSQTIIDVDVDDQEAVIASQNFAVSEVRIEGNRIDIDGTIVAHGGDVKITATNLSGRPGIDTPYLADANTGIYLKEHGVIDVSGLNATAPMSRHQLSARLFSEQFKDAPAQRGGSLFGERVFINALKGTTLFDIAGLKAALAVQTAAEKSVVAGNVTFATRGKVITDAKSIIDISGGVLTYKEGYLQESTIIANGKGVAMSKASPDILYQGVADFYTVKDDKWGISRIWGLRRDDSANSTWTMANADVNDFMIAKYQVVTAGDLHAAFDEGGAAGTLDITGVALDLPFGGSPYASKILLDGTLKAHTLIASTQREKSAAGGDLTIVSSANGNVVLSASNAPLAANESHINTGIFDSGISRFTLGLTNAGFENTGTISVDSAIITGTSTRINKLSNGVTQTVVSGVTLTAPNIAINANITAPGGAITVTTNGNDVTKGLLVADGVKLSTAGLWVNDFAATGSPILAGTSYAPVVLNGGNISLAVGVVGPNSLAAMLKLGKDSVLDASAGAWFKANKKLVGGNGGNINVTSGFLSPIETLGSFESYGFNKGGKLSLTISSNVQVGGQAPLVASTYWLPSAFFEENGFSSYSIKSNATAPALIIGDVSGAPTLIQPKMQTLKLNPSSINRPSGALMQDVATPVLLAEGMRAPTSLSLEAKGDILDTSLVVLPNTVIRTDTPVIGSNVRGNISLKSSGDMDVRGDLIAPAGSISVGGNRVLIANAVKVLALGHYAVPMGASNLLKAEVFNAGNIDVRATELFTLAQGALLDVSGVSGQVDVIGVNGRHQETRYGAAGGIGISANLNVILDGDIRGAAAGNGKAGSFSLAFTGTDALDGADRALTMTQYRQLSTGSLVSGKSFISAEQIMDGGFDRVAFGHSITNSFGAARLGDGVVLSSGLDLRVPGSLSVSVNKMTGNGIAQLTSGYVLLSGGGDSTVGTATLKVNADWIDVFGGAIGGVNVTQLSSRLDIRSQGIFTTRGEMQLSARQIYAESGAVGSFVATGTNSRIEIMSSGATPTPVLSAGSTLKFSANDIVQGGVLRAPMGSIELNAVNSLTLKANSLTSVSADGLVIPYGKVNESGAWFPPGFVGGGLSSDPGASAMPDKVVRLISKNVNLQPGAVIDISGGGDVEGNRWVPGIGGSRDFLSGLPDSNGNPTVFAVLPNKTGEYAPTLAGNVGNAVYLAGAPGLAAGIYTLMPASFATLPGAFMLEMNASRPLSPNQSAKQQNGTTLVSGYGTTLGTDGRDSKWSTYTLTAGSVFRPAKGAISRAPSEYFYVSGNQFFRDKALKVDLPVPRLPFDAGRLVLDASQNLTLAATILSNKPTGALGSQIDISNTKIRVVSDFDPSDISGALQLTTRDLNNLHASSLLLGGTRGRIQIDDIHSSDPLVTIDDPNDNTVVFKTNATDVVFANDADHVLAVSELIAVAKNNLTVNAGAVLDTVAGTVPAIDRKILADGAGALLAISGESDLVFQRTNPDAANGILTIQNGANIHAHRSLAMDATQTFTLAGLLTVDTGGSATLGANLVELGSSASASAGLRLDNNTLLGLGNIARMTVNTGSYVQAISAVNFGNQNLDLVFNTGGITGALGAGQVTNLVAKTFTLKNTSGVTSTSPVGTNGTLNITANTVKLEGKDPALTTNPANAGIATLGDGFAAVNVTATGELLVSGTGTTTFGKAGVTTTLSSARLTSASSSDYTLTSAGTLSTVKTAAAEVLPSAQGLGGIVKMTAATLNLGGNIELPSGQFFATATTGNLTVASDAIIKASSIPVDFAGYATMYTPGGLIALNATLGNVSVVSGATIDVSGAGDADAGTFRVNAINGNVDVAAGAVLKGSATASRQAGTFELDAKTMTNFSNLNAALSAGQFSSQDLRIRTGDVVIAAGDTVTAQHFVLSADGAGSVGGNIDIFGTVNADGSNGGSIEIYAQKNLTLRSSAKLLARGTGDALVLRDGRVGAGGSVMLSSYSTAVNAISAATGAVIDVSGDQVGTVKGALGKVTIRGMRSGAGAGTGVDTIATNVSAAVVGAQALRLEAVKLYGGAAAYTLNAAKQTIIRNDTDAFINAATPGLAAYGLTQDGKNVVLAAGVEGRASGAAAAGTITTAEWNLNDTDTANGQSIRDIDGTLTLRAANNLLLNGGINDGYERVKSDPGQADFGKLEFVDNDKTWGYNFIAGADFTAANPFATIKSATPTATGRMVLNNNVVIRTGSEGIRIATGGDLNLNSVGSTIYTVGERLAMTDGVPGFVISSDADFGGALTDQIIPLYMTRGGDVAIRSQGNLVGAEPYAAALNDWLVQVGGDTGLGDGKFQDTSWWVRPDLFTQGVAAFGGGNIKIVADGNIKQFSASIATTARYDVFSDEVGTRSQTGDFSVDGGGNLLVKAGGDIQGGSYFSGRGPVRLIAGGAVGTADFADGVAFPLQDTQVDVTAMGDIYLLNAVNPTLTQNNQVINFVGSFFSTLAPTASLNLSSVRGDVVVATSLYSNAQTDPYPYGLDLSGAMKELIKSLPGSLTVNAFTGNISMGNFSTVTLLASAQGNLRLLAGGDVTGSVFMSDSNPQDLPGIFNPVVSYPGFGPASTADSFIKTHAAIPIHINDEQPVLIVAKTGKVELGVDLPKQALIHSAKNSTIKGSIQQISASDISSVEIGGDLNMSEFSISGPGNLLVKAEGDINIIGLGASNFQSVANTTNNALSNQGASITLLAGLGKQGDKVADYIATYINPIGVGPSTMLAGSVALAEYRLQTAKAVGDYMRELAGNSTLPDAEAMTQYLALDANRQAVFAYRHFSSELAVTGQTFANTQSYARGDSAIATLFPAGSGYQGNIYVLGANLKTLRNSSIDILAPGGFVTAGQPGGDSGSIITERGGAIRAFAESDFSVNSGKVITQFSGDITVWVNNGDIDAGRGSQFAISVPERQVSNDVDGFFTSIFNGVATGSGIRAQTFDPDGPNGPLEAPLKGTVTLVAPRGVLNVSEGGIEGGKVFIAALTVIDPFQNISATSVVGGLVDAGGLAGALGGLNKGDASQAGVDDATKIGPKSNPFSSKNFLPSFVSVEVIGLGN